MPITDIDTKMNIKLFFLDLPTFDQTMSKSNDDIVANIKSSRFVVSTNIPTRMIIE